MTGAPHLRLGLWRRLMLLIGGTVALMWLALALTSVTFARLQSQFSGLAASQVPRIALTGELAGHSAHLAGLATRIIGGEGESEAQLAEVASTAAELDAALNDPALQLPGGAGLGDTGTGAGAAGGSVAMLQRDLARLPPLYQRRKDLDDSISRDIDTLRWLNIDIQDEVDPLLNDYDFNIRTRMLELQQEDDPSGRAEMVAQVGRDRQLRDRVFQLGSDAGSTVTLLLQIAVSDDDRQIDQLAGLAYDLLSRLGESVAALPDRTEFLTLRQSVDRLRALVDPPSGPDHGLIGRRKAGVALQAVIYGHIQSVQEGVAQLQDHLARLSAGQKQGVLASISATAEAARWTMTGLVALTLILGAMGLAIVFGVMRRRIISPLRALMGRMLAISETAGAALPASATLDEISRIRIAVDEFGRSIEARDRAILQLRETQAELVQAGKMAALGSLSAGISHELNQPLAALRYRLVLLDGARAAGNTDEQQRQLERIGDLAQRMEAIISHLRRFAPRAENRREALRLREQIEAALSLLQGRLDQVPVAIDVSPAADQARVLGDPILTEQVILNLLGNALDAIAERQGAQGTQGQATGRIQIDAKAEGGWIDLTLRDDGIGLGDLTPEQAINPFVTSKEAGRGMGLGLSISYNIAKDMGGDLSLAAAPEGGVVARLRLPAAGQDDQGP